jgi:hypothetical protein
MSSVYREHNVYGKVKEGKAIPVNRRWRLIGLWDIEASTFSVDSRLTEGRKFVSPKRR